VYLGFFLSKYILEILKTAINKVLKKEPAKKSIEYLNMLVECIACNLKM